MSADTMRKNSVSAPPQSLSSSSSSKNKPQIITPSILENSLGEIIQYRNTLLTEFQELGQPDLIHISKYDKSIKQEIGEYHYATGINNSSIIQPLMYLQTIQLNDKIQATLKHLKIATYCSYNIFTRGDLRIRCQFPNSNNPLVQFIPSDKSKITINLSNDNNSNNANAHLWDEIYVSSLIRSLLFADSIERQLPGMCKFNPIQSTKDSKEAIALMCSLLPIGVKTGCSDLYNRPSLLNNYLVDSLLKILSITNYYDYAIDQVNKIMNDNKINLNVLTVKILIMKNDFAKAVKLMHTSLLNFSRDGWMLNEQVKFLISQNRFDLALLPAIISVECLPSEFEVWKNLILIYIFKNDIKNALLALNSSPMYINKRKDIYKAIKPKSFEFKFPFDGKIESIWKNSENFGCISGFGNIVEFSNPEEISKITNRFRLKVYEETKLNCTFKESYNLLSLMTRNSSWSQLLKIRSEIFVMEDEYNENDNDLGTNENKFKFKRLSEKWLDSLFLIFYENLKNVLIYENDSTNKPLLSYTPLELELIGNECFNVHYFAQGLNAFDKSLDQRFSIFAAYKLLDYYLKYSENEKIFREINKLENDSFELDVDDILKLCCKLISWNARYYDEFPIIVLQTIKQIIKSNNDSDISVIKSKIEFIILDFEKADKTNRKSATSEDKEIFREMETSQNIHGLLDRYLSWISQFDNEL